VHRGFQHGESRREFGLGDDQRRQKAQRVLAGADQQFWT
jgi:hypothetical protein